MDVVNEEHVSTLLSMGFHLEDARRSLQFSKNDLNEAVAILTDDHPTTRYTNLYDVTADAYFSSTSSQTTESQCQALVPVVSSSSSEDLEFPLGNLYELENRVYTESWSIPYKREESLSKCLVAAIRFAKQGKCDTDPNCCRFIYKCMPEAFSKLLMSSVAQRWPGEVQEGIFEMLQMFIQLLIIRLNKDPLPLELLNLLKTVFNNESEFCQKNKLKSSDKALHWEEIFKGKVFARSSSHKEAYGWLTDLINQFAELEGFEIIKAKLDQCITADLLEINALFEPFASCAEFLNVEAVGPYLRDGVLSSMKFARELTDFKEKRVGNVCDLLTSLKHICLSLWPEMVPELDKLRLDITLRMLKFNNFNAKMNGIKEVTRMIKETQQNRLSKLALPQEELVEWIVNDRILSIALEGSIDKAQYCGHIKTIVDFLGPRLLDEEVSKIWSKQSGEYSIVVDNIHNIVAAAAVKFSKQQFENLVSLIDTTWREEGSFMREKLIKLIGWIGKESENQHILMRVLELLWDLSHLSGLKATLLDRALLEHLSIINESMTAREPIKKLYIHKCVEDIKEGIWILPAMRHLTEIVKGVGKSNSSKAEKEILQELNHDHEIIRLVTESLSKCHDVDNKAPDFARQNYVNTHLDFLQFILVAGCFYLPWKRCKEIWDTLVNHPHTIEWNREICFEWFSRSMRDLEQTTQALIFQEELLRENPQKISQPGFECFKCFFEEVNAQKNKLKRVNMTMVVESTDLLGLNYLWEICLSTQKQPIAEAAIGMLLSMSYLNLAPRFKKSQDTENLHQKFINVWYNLLEKAKHSLERNLPDLSLSDGGASTYQSARSAAILSIERLLTVAERYVVSVEELFTGRRTIPAHAATFRGHSIKLCISCETPKMEFSIMAHSNESVDSLKQKIAREVRSSPDLVQFMPNEKVPNKEHKRLYQLSLEDNQVLNIRVLSSVISSISSSTQDVPCSSFRHSTDLDREKMLPSVIMCSGWQIFEILYQLAALDQPKIANRVRQLLRLIPTDPKVLQSFEDVDQKTTNAAAATSDHQEPTLLKVLNSPMKQPTLASDSDRPEKLLPSFDTISKQILTSDFPPSMSSSLPTTVAPPVAPSSLHLLTQVNKSLSNSVPTDVQAQVPSATTSPSSLSSSTLRSSTSTLLITPPTPSPHQILVSLLTPLSSSASGLPLFQILYNLEVLSSKLMPTHQVDINAIQAAHGFCQKFLEAAGLNLVVAILQKDLSSCEADYETTQGCYAICLQLLRFLLCGDDGGAVSTAMRPSSALGASGFSPTNSFSASCTACRAIQTMDAAEFTNTISCFINVAWTAATGKHHHRLLPPPAATELAGKDSAVSVDSKSSLSLSGEQQHSAESGLSSGGELDHVALHHGTQGAPRSYLSSTFSRDKYIACEAIELLVKCLKLNSSFIDLFYALPSSSEFIIDVLVTSPHEEVRDTALEQFTLLCHSVATPVYECRDLDDPRLQATTTRPRSETSPKIDSVLDESEEIEARNAGDCKPRFAKPQQQLKQESPKKKKQQFILSTLMKARLPFWVTSVKIRGVNYRLLEQCKQYFELKARLLANLTVGTQSLLQLDVDRLLGDEIAWLKNFVCPEGPVQSESVVSTLLTGHLKVIRNLITCEGVNKTKYGSSLIQDLLYSFLFPAAKMIMDDTSVGSDPEGGLSNFVAKCSSSESREAAYDFLVELAHGDLKNMTGICKELIKMHHASLNSDMINQWEYMPPVDGRHPCGYVGLKNAGATCYMNSVLQQIFMTPGITEFILSIEDDQLSDDSILFQVQQTLGHLLDSKLQFYVPEGLWNVFKLWGNNVNLREHQDVMDFFQALIDQMDEELKKLGREQIFKKTFQGSYSDQKNCQGCDHRYEKEEAFYNLTVTVMNATLQDSLDQFIKGELLEAGNAYYCEKCAMKRTTIKRTCIKALPPVLCIQLKRFDYDWEANRSIKFDDYFKFPLVLDMEPYTAEGLAWREEQSQIETSSDSESRATPVTFASDEDFSNVDVPMEVDVELSPEVVTPTQKRPFLRNVNVSFCRPTNHVNYDLVGVVVHSGQANAGHYYSFIKERRGTYSANPNKGKWFKFNDTTVEEFDMNDANLESECFGGKYRAKVADTSSYQYPEERQRHWNGYLLFYEKAEDVKTPVSAKKSKVSSASYKTFPEKSSISHRQDSLKQLTELVHKGEKRGLFSNKMPVRVQQVVRAENLQFVKNRNVFELEYFSFVRKLASTNINSMNLKDQMELNIQSLQLSTMFLFNTYYRTKFKLRIDMNEWESCLLTIIGQSKETCAWMVSYLSRESLNIIKPLLLDCPAKEIRSSFGLILEKTMSCFYLFGGSSMDPEFNAIVESLLGLLSKGVPDNFKQSFQFFKVLFTYARLSEDACSHLYNKGAFNRLAEFLLGPVSMLEQVTTRRWGPLQSRDFGLLHSTLAILVLHSDVAPFRTHVSSDSSSEGNQAYKPINVSSQAYLTMPPEMIRFLFGDFSPRYLQEIVLALREITSGVEFLQDMILYCCFNNKTFSLSILIKIFSQCLNAPSNELRHLFHVLLQILLLEDGLRRVRLIFIMEEVAEEKSSSTKGMLGLIRQQHTGDSKRSYQFIKFLVNLSNSCTVAKDYLLGASAKWQWAAKWLENKMAESCWNANAIMSNDETISHSFQRTISAQNTLAGATALLTELDCHDPELDKRMDTTTIEDDGGDQQPQLLLQPDDDADFQPQRMSLVVSSEHFMEDLDGNQQ